MINLLEKNNIELPFEGVEEEVFDKMTDTAKEVVRYIYYFFAFFSIQLFSRMTHFVRSGPPDYFSIDWPIAWAHYFSFYETLYIVQILIILGGLLSALYYKKVWARVFAFFAFFQAHGFFNSTVETIEHSNYIFFYLLFFLMFLPNIWERSKVSKLLKKKFLLYFWATQAFVLLIYTMTGIDKVVTSINQILAGGTGLLSIDGFSSLVYQLTAQYRGGGILTDLIVNNPWLGWVISTFYIYVLVFAIVIAFRPALHKWWGVLLVLYHVGGFATLGLGFAVFAGVNIFLFFNSPFVVSEDSLRDKFKKLPVVGDLLLYVGKV